MHTIAHPRQSLSTSLSVAGFSSLEASPQSDGSISFNGTAKVKGSTYFAIIKVTFRDDGSPKIGLGDYKFETFTGKSARGAANVPLEDLMADAKESALAWAKQFSGAAPDITDSDNPT